MPPTPRPTRLAWARVRRWSRPGPKASRPVPGPTPVMPRVQPRTPRRQPVTLTPPGPRGLRPRPTRRRPARPVRPAGSSRVSVRDQALLTLPAVSSDTVLGATPRRVTRAPHAPGSRPGGSSPAPRGRLSSRGPVDVVLVTRPVRSLPLGPVDRPRHRNSSRPQHHVGRPRFSSGLVARQVPSPGPRTSASRDVSCRVVRRPPPRPRGRRDRHRPPLSRPHPPVATSSDPVVACRWVVLGEEGLTRPVLGVLAETG